MAQREARTRYRSRRGAALIRAVLVIVALLGAERGFAQTAAFTSEPVTTAAVAEPYVYQVVASNGGTSAITITAPTGLPPWLTLTVTGNGTATLAGTPPAPTAPTVPTTPPWHVYLRAEDAGCPGIFVFLCQVQQFDIVVAPPNSPPVVSAPIADQSVSEGQSLNLAVASAFSDPDGDPLTFTATGLPNGLSLAPSGSISGLVTLAIAQGSPYDVTVTAADGRGGTVSDAFVLTAVPLARSDLAVTSISATPSPATRGASVSWVVTVRNTGPGPIGSADLAIEFAGTPVAFTTNPCTLSVESDRQRLACTLGPIDNGGTATVTLAGSAAQRGDVFVTATVSTTAVPGDPNGTNNSSRLGLNVGDSIVTDPAQPIELGASAIALGDLNGDSYADAVIAKDEESPSVLLDVENPAAINATLAQPGDRRRGLANVPLAFGSGNVGADVALADFDNDLDLDVVVANGAGTPSAAFANDGAAALTQLATLGAAARVDRAVAVADMNGDGFVDVVIASTSGNTLYTNQNGSGFAASALPAQGGAGAVDVVLADVVGTPLPDLVLAYANSPPVRHENLGGNSFGPAVTIDPSPVAGVATADFNRDGRADLVLARSAPPQSGVPSNPVYLNNNSGGFVAVGSLGATPTTAVLAGDVDGDGLSDVVSINATGTHQLFRGDGNGNFELTPGLLVARGATNGTFGPVGRMKRADLVLVGPSALSVFFNDGRGGFGLGDTTRPVIQLNGVADVSVEVGATYSDQGATANDDVDGLLTPSVTNDVNTAVIGTYAVTFAAMDSAGNAAVPVSRTVRVAATAAQGGGGGASGAAFLALLCAALFAKWRRLSAPRVKENPNMTISNSSAARRSRAALALAALGAAFAGARADATELSYTYIDFGGLTVDSSLAGSKIPAATQQVFVESGDGDGLVVSGSLALGRHFYLWGGYDSSVVDVDALVTSPLATASISGNFDLVTTRAAFGYYYPFGEKLDVLAEVAYETVDYDFGSFAGESFDVDEAGASYGVGLRYSASPAVELFVLARSSSIGEVNLTTSTVDTAAHVSAGLRVYFFEDLGLGFDLRSGGDVDSLTVSMRFGFGELRAGRD